MSAIDPFLPRTDIAYFSMEIALRPEIHTYSGGLGMLAGDTARSCADLELPVVFITLASRAGYLREKDGLWAVLMWLNILAVRQQSVPVLHASHDIGFQRNHDELTQRLAPAPKSRGNGLTTEAKRLADGFRRFS